MRRSAILRTPPQGWSSLLGFLLMLGVVGIAITNAHPLSPADFERPWTLAILMATSGLVGFVLARSSIGLVRSHIIGASAGALLLILAVAAAVGADDGDALLRWLLEPELLSSRIESLWLAVRSDIDAAAAVRPISETQAAGMLILGAICWTTGQFGASSIYRFDRGVPAVAAAGILLLLAVALPPTPGAQPLDVVLVLAVFTLFAMLMLVRLQLNHQRTGWLRRHIADTGEVSRLFLRTGSIFVVLSVVGASTLTLATEDTVVDGPWEDWDGQLPELGDEFEKLLGWFAIRPEPREPTTFDGYNAIAPKWEDRDGIAFYAEGVDLRGNYWWANADDVFDGNGWDKSDRTGMRVEAGGIIQPAVGDIEQGRREITVSVLPGDLGLALGTLLAPAEPVGADRQVDVVNIGRPGSRGTIKYRDELDPGEVARSTTFALDYLSRDSELTKAALRAAGTDYPPELERYLEVREGSVGRRTREFAREIRRGFDTPYDQAKEVERRLRRYEYRADMTGVCDGYGSKTECLLGEEQGFCQYYASTMAMTLRLMGVPTRLVTGYLPGEIDPEDGTWEVPLRALHAWPEVWFEGFGWVKFDPTPLDDEFNRERWDPPAGNEPPTGPPGADDTPDQTFEPERETPEPSLAPIDGDVTEPPAGSGGEIPQPLLLMLAAVATFLSLAVVATVRLRRLPRADAGLAYLGIVSLATKLGHGPHPSQTELEYAGTLSEVIPAVDRELYLVAHAVVESSYAESPPVRTDTGGLRKAYSRIRTALLRLSLRGKG